MKTFQKCMQTMLATIFIVHSAQAAVNKLHKSAPTYTPTPTKKLDVKSDTADYENALGSAVSHYLKDLEAANKDESKIMSAMDKYEKQLMLIDQKYPDAAKKEAAAHLAKMTERKAKWHNYDLAMTNVRNKFTKELDPYWKAQQEIWHASWNRSMEKNIDLRKRAQKIAQEAMHSLEFQYSDALARFHGEMQELNKQYSY
jgi:hypothetical protein